MDISVIQGSILGPILFCVKLMINLYSATALFSVLFADDTTCLSKGKNLNELIEFVNSELQKIALWFRANKMAVNTSKTKFIVFRTRGKVISPEECVLQFNNNEPGQPADPALVSQIDRIHNEKILPLDEMIKYTRLKFMHNYVHNRFPFSFNETWIYIYMRNPDCVLRYANDLYVPAHHFATVKRFPLFLFPQL